MVYDIPNCIVPIIGGFVIDKYGIRKGFCISMFISLVGNLMFGIGALTHNFLLMLIGRGVFGLVNNSLHICTLMVVTLWFVDKHLNFALGLLIIYPCIFSLICT